MCGNGYREMCVGQWGEMERGEDGMRSVEDGVWNSSFRLFGVEDECG